MTPEQELEVLNEVYVADSPYDTQLNIAKRIKELLDKTDSLEILRNPFVKSKQTPPPFNE